jgi:hypothetical protein
VKQNSLMAATRRHHVKQDSVMAAALAPFPCHVTLREQQSTLCDWTSTKGKFIKCRNNKGKPFIPRYSGFRFYEKLSFHPHSFPTPCYPSKLFQSHRICGNLQIGNSKSFIIGISSSQWVCCRNTVFQQMGLLKHRTQKFLTYLPAAYLLI